MEKVRVNITLSAELKNWYADQADSYGCTVSSMMAMALAQYKQSLEGMNAIKDFSNLLEGLKDIQKAIPSMKDVDSVLPLNDYLKKEK